ncbi:hypothetical protein [Streptomonospora arabica]|uniref:Lipoprotein n=1 Tax=Streptomonospora arabica TaxID=412417 RepID=A0ABV9SH99_9ACTN
MVPTQDGFRTVMAIGAAAALAALAIAACLPRRPRTEDEGAGRPPSAAFKEPAAR